MLVCSRHILTTVSLNAALLVAPGLGAQAEDWIKGKVAGIDGKSIAGVTITVTSPGLPDYREETVSSRKGKFRIKVSGAIAPYEVRLSREGFHELLVQVQPVVDGTTTVDAVMVRVDDEQSGQRKPSTGPGSAAAAYQEGIEALKAGDAETAVEKLQQVIDLDRDVAQAHSYLAQALYEQREYTAAAVAAERALELDPADARALYLRYQAYRALGDDERAEGALAALKGSDESEGSAKRIFNEGAVAYGAGDMATAESMFLLATEIDPALPEAWSALAEIYRLEGDFEQSLKMTNTVLELRPGDARALRLRFTALFSLQRTDDLRTAVDELVAADPEWAASRLPQLALGAFNENLMNTAVVLYEKTVEIDPSNAKAHYSLGLCYFNLGDTARAGNAMKRFLELAPDDPDAASARSMLEYLD